MGAKNIDPTGIRTTDLPIHGHPHYPLRYDSLNFPMKRPISYLQQALLRSTRDNSKMMNESVKKSLEKAKNVLEEKHKIVKQKICIKKTHMFTIIVFIKRVSSKMGPKFLHV